MLGCSIDDGTAFELGVTSIEPKDDTVLETGAIPVELIRVEVVAASEFDSDEDSALKLEEIPVEPKDEARDVLVDCEFEDTGRKEDLSEGPVESRDDGTEVFAACVFAIDGDA